MFAADPARGAREIAPGAAPGRPRSRVAVWGPRARNPWLGLVLDAVGAELGRPVPPPGCPGPFALGDPERLAALFSEAGLADVGVEEVPRRCDGDRRGVVAGARRAGRAARAHPRLAARAGARRDPRTAPARRRALRDARRDGVPGRRAHRVGACRLTHSCIATADAAAALIERVEPNWRIASTATASSRAAGESPGPLGRTAARSARQRVGVDRLGARQVVDAKHRELVAARPGGELLDGRRGGARAGSGRSPSRRGGSSGAGRRCAPQPPGTRWRCARRSRCSGRAPSSRPRRGRDGGGRRGRRRSRRDASSGSGRRRCGGRPPPATPDRAAGRQATGRGGVRRRPRAASRSRRETLAPVASQPPMNSSATSAIISICGHGGPSGAAGAGRPPTGARSGGARRP